MNKFVKWGLVGLVAIGLTGLGIRSFIPRTNKDLKAAPVQKGNRMKKILDVRAVVLQEQVLKDEIFVSGSLIPDEQVNLTFESSGKITDIYFQEGAFVNEGTLLAKINDAPLQAKLHKLEAQLKLKKDRLYRQKALLEKEAVSKEAFQEAEANLSTLQADIEGMQAEIAQTELRAPFSGVVGLREVSVGAFATTSTRIATLTKTNPLKIEFSVPERYAGILKNDAPLNFTAEGDINPRSAKLYAMDSHVDPQTRTYTVRALYDNPKGELVPGRYVNVSLTTRAFDKAMAVPSEAIVSEMGIDKVFVCKNSCAVPTEIIKGLRTDRQVQVLGGLNIGDTIIVSGTMQLRTGQKVKIVNLK